MNDKKYASVSVVIPCYRCKETIRRAVDSVAAQTMLPAEVILVDDASGDGTLELLLSLQQRHGADWLNIISAPGNGGAAIARNLGWSAATQRYIAFLDADDSWHPRKIEFQFGWMEAHPQAMMTGHASTVLEGEAAAAAIQVSFGNPIRVVPSALLLSNRFSTPTVMLRRDIAQRFNPEKRRGEDYLLWLEICLSGLEVWRFPMALAYIHKARFGAGGLSGDLLLMQHGEIDAYRKLWRGGQLGAMRYSFFWLFSWAKYMRRCVVKNLRPA